MACVQKSDAFTRYVALQSMRDEIVEQIILGEVPLSAYDDFLEDFLATSADEILEQANALK